MTLSELDKELLELLALEVSWSMACGEFHARYGSPGALARRLFELEHAGLLEVRSADESPTSPRLLEAHAAANGCYQDLDAMADCVWVLIATEAGFKVIEDRLAAQ